MTLHPKGETTYSLEVSFAIVLFPSVKIIIDGSEARASATTVLCLQTEHSDSVLLVLALEFLGERHFDVSLLDTSHLGVDQLNSLETERGVSRGLMMREAHTHCLLPRRGFTMTFRM